MARELSLQVQYYLDVQKPGEVGGREVGLEGRSGNKAQRDAKAKDPPQKSRKFS